MRIVALVVLLFALLPARAEAKWTEVRSANFLFVGDASEGQIRDIARQMELFHEVMVRALPGAATVSPVPTVVLVFATGRSLQPVRPMFRGNAVDVGGYFMGSEDVSYIAINAEFAALALLTVYHEYSHALVSNTLGPMPAWVGEGLAEVYETMEQQRGGASALLGRAPTQHLALLNNSTLIPLRDLTSVDHQSSMYNEGTRRGVFYAQSWALVHYLTFGNPTRAQQFRQFLSGVRAGGEPRTIFRAAFGPEEVLERELFEYVRRFTFPAMRFDFDARVTAQAVPKGRTIDDVDADIYVADLQSRIGRDQEAKDRLAAIFKRRPEAPRALVSQAMEHLRAGRVDEASPLLERATALAPNDAWAQAALGRALVTRLGGTAAGGPEWEQARAVLARAVELDANSAFSAAMLGYVELGRDADLPRATALLERAVQLAPARESYRLFLAQALMGQREFTRARNILGALSEGGREPETRTQARRLIARLADMENPSAAAKEQARPAVDVAALAELGRPQTPPVESGRTADAPRASGGPSSADQPLRVSELAPGGLALRRLGIGETRVPGRFRAIECARGSAVLIVESDAGMLRLRTKAIDDVDFISYRTDGLSSVNCGPLPAPQRVLATYRPAAEGSGTAATAGEAVAIELLPDDYNPK